jgi:alanine dehydrogenase
MRIGLPREIKQGEGRVALTPDGARALVASGHSVVVEKGAGSGAGFADEEYASAGARLGSAADAWSSDLVVKVKEPLESEYAFLSDQILFTYLHLAGVDPGLTEALLRAGTTAIAYETITDSSGALPLLKPMSAVAGSMAPLVGSHHLAKPRGGRGVLVGEILGTRFGKVVVIGDGIVGQHAAKVAGAMGGRVLVFGRDPERKRSLESLAPGITFALSTRAAIAAELGDTDLLIGAVLIQGARAPSVVSEQMVASMPEGAVIVDVSIDQGGCIATSRPTTHADPVFLSHGVIHYCVTNMPGAYPRTSTLALTAATLSYLCELADLGLEQWILDNGRAQGVNTYRGCITNARVAEALDRDDEYRALGDFTP